MPDPISILISGGTTQVTLDRPPVNALDLEAIEALRAAFETADKAAPVILTGAGGVFSAGVDTRAFGGYRPEQKAEMIRAITALTAAVLSHPAPVVAAVPGHALGGGFVLMLCCDVRLVADGAKARFGLTEAKAGVPFPAGPLEIIRDQLEPNLLRRLTLTSETIDAEALGRYGIADRLVPEGNLLDVAQAVALETASQPAFRTVKRQMRGHLIDCVRSLAEDSNDPLAQSFLK